jgi:stage II sporulation protein AA (anti-sigma F factor antagonist)
MEVTTEHLGNVLLVTVSGRLDTGTAPVFDAQLAPLLAEPRPQILLDLGAVTYISSAGLRSILQLVKHTAAHGGRVGLHSAPGHIMEVVEISGFPSLLDVYPDRATALSRHAK